MKSDSIYIEINTECNLRCTHCYNKSGVKSENMDIEDFKRIVAFFLKDSESELSLTVAGGEPLLHPQINQYLTYLRALGSNQVKVLIITNGILAKDILTPYLLQESPFSVQLSLDGASEETNKFIRGPGHFEKVVSYMQYLSLQGYRHGKSKMTINKYNLLDIEPFFELSINNFFIPLFSFVERSGRADMNWDNLNVAHVDRSKAIELINRLYVANSERLKCIDNAFDVQKIMLSWVTKQCPLIKPSTVLRPIIKANGDVQPCHHLYDNSYTIGNILSSDLETVFSNDNERFTAVKNALEKRIIFLKENACSSCVIKGICSCGCPGRAIDEFGEIMNVDPDCSFRIEEYVKKNFKLLSQGE